MRSSNVFILPRVEFPIGNYIVSKQSDGTYSIETPSKTLDVPLVDIDADESELKRKELDYLKYAINAYLIERTWQGAKTNTVDQDALNLQEYARWLLQEDQKHIWCKFGASLSRKPTYGYKAHLQDRIVKSDIAPSTANQRIQTVKRFYDFVIRREMIHLEESQRPYIPKSFQFFTGRSMRHVKSSDLAIKVPKRAQGESLNPLSDEDYKLFVEELRILPDNKRIPLALMLICGLRIETAASFPSCVVKLEAITKQSEKDDLIRKVMLSPSDGVKLKFDKRHEVFMTPDLMRLLYRYLKSAHRADQVDKYLKIHPAADEERLPLFITQQGNPLSRQSLYKIWQEVKEQVQRKHGAAFEHKPHDLRCTFATRCFRAAKKAGGVTETAISVVQKWLGHESYHTTISYVKFVEQHDELRAIQKYVDQEVYKALTEGSSNVEQ